MHNEGLISVVYTVSNIRALSLLAKGKPSSFISNMSFLYFMFINLIVSGHRTRLKSQSFPGISDIAMVQQLTDYAFKPDPGISFIVIVIVLIDLK